MLPRLALLALVGCADIKEIGGGWGVDLTWIPGVGQVFLCHAEEQELELCYDGEANELSLSLTENGFGAAICGSTPRHAGPCFYCCGDCGRGANAYMGSWCPP